MDSRPFPQDFLPERTHWLRLRTLILLRWLAILGQLSALVVATVVYEIGLPIGFCLLAIGMAVIANLVTMTIYPVNKRLTEKEALFALLFDLSQLTFLLFLTGGLSNPFSLLILVPVTISASVLALGRTVALGTLAMLFVTLIAAFNVPMRSAEGLAIQVPALFEFGFWLSLIIGIVFLGIYSRRVATEVRSMSDALLATQMALAREQKLTDLGGVVAAAAHELGTPLATIKMISTEMMDDLQNQEELLEDARLIRDQADRCRDILRSMGKSGKDDLHLRQAPLGAVLREAAEPHLARGKSVLIALGPGQGFDADAAFEEPAIYRRPEVIHGLRNLVQNAVDFARSRVWVDASWSESALTIRITDDGDGFPLQVINRIGDPFLRSRRSHGHDLERPGYEGMGLGLFIAKTLLERTGAEMSFANAASPFLAPEERPERCGAVVEVVWPVTAIAAPRGGGLGENPPIA